VYWPDTTVTVCGSPKGGKPGCGETDTSWVGSGRQVEAEVTGNVGVDVGHLTAEPVTHRDFSGEGPVRAGLVDRLHGAGRPNGRDPSTPVSAGAKGLSPQAARLSGGQRK